MFEKIAQKISRKFSIVFGALTLTVSASYLLSFWFNKNLKQDSIVLEIANTNRILSQQLDTKMQSIYNASTQEAVSILFNDVKNIDNQIDNSIQLFYLGGQDKQLTNGIQIDKETNPSILQTLDRIKTAKKELFHAIYNIQKTEKFISESDSTSSKTILNPRFNDGFNSYLNISKEERLFNLNKQLIRQLSENNEREKAFYTNLLIFLLILNVSFILSTYFYIRRIVKPIEPITDFVKHLSKGELPVALEIKSKDEIGEIGKAVNTLGANIEAASLFAENVGNGMLDTEIEVFENHGKLSNSLRVMRDNLSRVADEEAKRNWATEGFAKFVDILRATDDIERFYNTVLGDLIRYVGVNQGYLYVVSDEDSDEPFMEIKAVYAYGKQRYLEEKNNVHFKEGLVGQAWFDKDCLYFTEIPASYVKITSGMGEATPTCIFIVPLIINEQVVGAIELASFEPLQDYVREFIFKLGETIAGSILNVKVNERTKHLLHESQRKEESLRSQEEEIRQNMEEMKATQAEMERAQRAMHEALKVAESKEQEALSVKQQFEKDKNLSKLNLMLNFR